MLNANDYKSVFILQFTLQLFYSMLVHWKISFHSKKKIAVHFQLCVKTAAVEQC